MDRPQLVEDRKRRIEAIAEERRVGRLIRVHLPDGTIKAIRKGEGSF